MLNMACRNTNKLIRAKSKSENIRLGRLFTKKGTARLMAGMVTLDPKRTAYTVLDPGAGTGILSAALVERICKECPDCKQIFLTCYETDPVFIPVLKDNLERIRKRCRHDYDVKLYLTVYEENYLIDSKNHYTVNFYETEEDTFDLIICNPPKELCLKSSEEAESTGGVTQLKVDAAYLFAGMASRHLQPNGYLVIVLPTATASAAGLSTFRKTMSEKLALCRVHLFIGRQKNEKRAVPLKKNMILAYKNGERGETVSVSTSTDDGADTTLLPPLPYTFVVNPDDGSLTLPKNAEDTRIVRYISAFPETLATLGLKIRTGKILDSRTKDLLFNDPAKGLVPLFRPSVIKDGMVTFPGVQKKAGSLTPYVQPKQYLAPVSAALVQKNKNMILIKRVFAKSDERCLNAAIHLAAGLPLYPYISTHNKVLYIDTKSNKEEMSARFVYGLFALLNSTVYDRYVSIITKSKQINAKEFRDLPLPPRNLIENMGMRLMAMRMTTVKACDSIVNPTLHIIDKTEG